MYCILRVTARSTKTSGVVKPWCAVCDRVPELMDVRSPTKQSVVGEPIGRELIWVALIFAMGFCDRGSSRRCTLKFWSPALEHGHIVLPKHRDGG